jgi:predicted Rossmann fold flavoprotein
MFDVAIVGAGAAGYFAAINIKLNAEDAKIVILEKTSKTLSKVEVSGGGRCNVTHNEIDPTKLSENYPRGGKFLKSLFRKFGVAETIHWFKEHNVELKTEDDGRMFPVSNTSETIVHLFESLAQKLGIEVWTKTGVVEFLLENNEKHTLQLSNNESIESKFVVLASGGLNKHDSANYLKNFDIQFEKSVPSLFTFNIRNSELNALSGISVKNGKVKIVGLKKSYSGPILVTHWGLSGPAVLKTSSWFASELNEKGYHFDTLISWIDYSTEEEAYQELIDILLESPKKQMNNLYLFALPQRLWLFILAESKIDETKKCIDLKKAEINKLLENLIRMPFTVIGKTTFKEEFVTAGGISLKEIDENEMNLKKYPTIYVAGEMLNIDGVTGGFNFQSAWTTAWFAANSIASKL